MGYIIQQDGLECYSSNEPPVFWGNMEAEVVYNNLERKLGSVQLDRGWVRDESGSTVCEMDRVGIATGRYGTFLGEFLGFTYHMMPKIALYMLIVDNDMLVEEQEE